MEKALDILHRYWGYNQFRPLQEDIISSIVSGTDTLALLPTGGGKSICFQVPALMKEGLCLVITPLIALMKDQVQHLRQLGIKAEAIYTGILHQELDVIFDNCQFGNYKFLYISPERLQSAEFLRRFKQLPVSMITVDEAHCISQWGYDFRPAYLKINSIREFFPNAPVLALTATATQEVVKDIQVRLTVKGTKPNWNIFQKSFVRENLVYVVRRTEDKLAQMLNILSKVNGSSIIYVRNRQKTKETADYLLKEGISATHFHAGISNQEKDKKQEQWKSGQIRVMVATNAFGMGIDKPDVRTVIHLDLPDSIEAYFQEAGRAGRDLQKAYAVLLYNPSDKTKLKKRITDNYPSTDFILKVYEAAGDWLEVGIGSGLDHTFAFPIDIFCKDKHLPILPTYSALQILSLAGYVNYIEETETNPRVQFITEKDQLYSTPLTTLQEKIVHALLRSYTGIFADTVFINENRLAQDLNIMPKRLVDELITLSRQRIIKFIPRLRTPYLNYPLERQPLQYIKITDDIYKNRQERYVDRLKAILEYAEQDQFCRSQLLVSYFGETKSECCGQCDVCLKKKAKK